jgi:TrmH family RNA methyltransferase
VRTISSRQNDVVRRFRELAGRPDANGVELLLDGAHLVGDARRAGTTIEVAAVAASKARGDAEEGRLARALADSGVDVVVASDELFAAMSPVRTPAGIVAIGRRTPIAPGDVCRRAGFILAAADIQDPGNLGSLLRAAEAGGIDGVIVCGASANPFSWKAVRGSMGSVLRLPVAAAPSVTSVLDCMKESGLRTIASVPRGGEAPERVDWTGRVGLLLGGEGTGLDAAIVAGSDARVTIPMAAPVESLNVAVAGALLVYAARQQRL